MAGDAGDPTVVMFVPQQHLCGTLSYIQASAIGAFLMDASQRSTARVAEVSRPSF
jgi:hypothetical protein